MKRLWAWGPPLGWMILIFGMSTRLGAGENTSRILGPLLEWLFPGTTPETISALRLVVRKFAHVTEYAVLCLLCLRAFRLSSALPSFRCLSWSVAIAVVYAVTDEWHQTRVPGRVGAVSDVVIDSVGALIGAMLWVAVRRLRCPRPPD